MSYEIVGFAVSPLDPEAPEALAKIDQLLDEGYVVAFTATITEHYPMPHVVVYLHKPRVYTRPIEGVSIPADHSILGLFDFNNIKP